MSALRSEFFNMMGKRLLLAVLTATVAFAVHAGMTTPSDTVQTTLDGVLATLSDSSLDEQTKRARAHEQITQAFNFESMSQRILATNWKNADAVQRERFVALFTDILANTYWSRLKAYTDQKVEVTGEKIKNGDLARVKTIIDTGTSQIPIDYSLKKYGDKWLAYDVVIEGVSLVRNYRATFQEIAKRDGLDGLLAQMEKKVAETG